MQFLLLLNNSTTDEEMKIYICIRACFDEAKIESIPAKHMTTRSGCWGLAIAQAECALAHSTHLRLRKRVESNLAYFITRHEIQDWVVGVAEYTSEVDVDSDTKLLFPESSVIRWPSSFKRGKLLPANINIRTSQVD